MNSITRKELEIIRQRINGQTGGTAGLEYPGGLIGLQLQHPTASISDEELQLAELREQTKANEGATGSQEYMI